MANDGPVGRGDGAPALAYPARAMPVAEALRYASETAVATVLEGPLDSGKQRRDQALRRTARIGGECGIAGRTDTRVAGLSS